MLLAGVALKLFDGVKAGGEIGEQVAPTRIRESNKLDRITIVVLIESSFSKEAK
jgi:hypothetical protein